MGQNNVEGTILMGGQTSKIVQLLGQQPKKQDKKTHDLLVSAFRPQKEGKKKAAA